MNRPWAWPPALDVRVLPLFDALAEEPVWRRALVTYVLASACLWLTAGLVHHEYGVASWPAFVFPLVIAANVVVSVAREVLSSPLYFAVLAGILLAVSRLTPGKRVSFRQLFSVTVHTGYILLAGHALRIVLAAGGVDLAGVAAALLPDPDAMFLGIPPPFCWIPPRRASWCMRPRYHFQRSLGPQPISRRWEYSIRPFTRCSPSRIAASAATRVLSVGRRGGAGFCARRCRLAAPGCRAVGAAGIDFVVQVPQLPEARYHRGQRFRLRGSPLSWLTSSGSGASRSLLEDLSRRPPPMPRPRGADGSGCRSRGRRPDRPAPPPPTRTKPVHPFALNREQFVGVPVLPAAVRPAVVEERRRCTDPVASTLHGFRSRAPSWMAKSRSPCRGRRGLPRPGAEKSGSVSAIRLADTPCRSLAGLERRRPGRNAPPPPSIGSAFPAP